MSFRFMMAGAVLAAAVGAPPAFAQGAGDEVESRTERAADRAERQAERTRDKAQAGGERTSDEGARKTGEARDKGEVQGDRVGEEITDTWITTKVKASFVGDDALKGSDISVDTESKGVVTLTGTVPNEAARARAVEVARSIKGVRSVRDQLRVAAR